VRVTTSAALDGLPVVRLAQTGGETIPVTMQAAGAGVYTGKATLDKALPLMGLAIADAENTTGQAVSAEANFEIAPVDASQDTTVYAGDGRAELFVPAGALAADDIISINLVALPGALPPGLRNFSGPYALATQSGANLQGRATLSLFHTTTTPIDPDTARLYRWSGAQWVALEGTTGPGVASAPVESLGVYALLARPRYPLYLPVTAR
jgi:hypothetical protein